MRKTTFAALLTVLFLGQMHAQDYQIGIKVGPTISFARTGTEGTNTSIDRDGTSARVLFGAFVDMAFKENYFFQTGLNYATKKTNIKFSDPGLIGGNQIRESYAHEYLQLPLLLKLFTNELTLDTKFYFNFGLIPEVRLSTSNEEVDIVAINEWQNFDLAGNLGTGVERNIGPHTKVFIGLNYNVGFLNMVNEQNSNLDEFTVKSNLLALEVGVKF